MFKKDLFVFLAVVMLSCGTALPNSVFIKPALAIPRHVGEFDPNSNFRQGFEALLDGIDKTQVPAPIVDVVKAAITALLGLDDAAIRSFVRNHFVNVYTVWAKANKSLGNPKDDGGSTYAHQWKWVLIQNFSGGKVGDCAIITSVLVPDLHVFAVTGNIWKAYAHTKGGERMGWPVSSVHIKRIGKTDWYFQRFKNGVIATAGNTTVVFYKERYYGVISSGNEIKKIYHW